MLYTIGIIFVFGVGYGFNLLLDKLLPESQAEPLLFIIEITLIILTVITSFWLAGRTLRPIANSYEQQKKFVADAAHELRTPLTVIKTGAETTLTGASTIKDYQNLARDSLEEVDYMSSTVNDLLFFAHSDAQQTPVFAKINLTQLVNRQTEVMQPYAHKKSVVLAQDCQAKCYVRGNHLYLKRLLNNLLQNAIDYNKPTGTVTVSLMQSRHEITLIVADTGIGIASKDLAHIFNRFYKADESRTKQSSGAGLGLSIVQEIVTSHCGQISVKSQLGKGTAVTVMLPAV